MKKEITINYEENISLIVLYEMISSIYDSSHYTYPIDVKDKVSELINLLLQYVNHSKKGYDILSEKVFTTVTYQNNHKK